MNASPDVVRELLAQLQWQRAHRIKPRAPQTAGVLKPVPPIVRSTLEQLAAAGISQLMLMKGGGARGITLGLSTGPNSAKTNMVALQPTLDQDVRVLLAQPAPTRLGSGATHIRVERIYTQDDSGIWVKRGTSARTPVSEAEFTLDLEMAIRQALAHELRHGTAFSGRIYTD